MKNKLFKTALLLCTLSGSLSNIYGMDQKALTGPSSIFEGLKTFISSQSTVSNALTKENGFAAVSATSAPYLLKQALQSKTTQAAIEKIKKSPSTPYFATAGIFATGGLFSGLTYAGYFKSPTLTKTLLDLSGKVASRMFTTLSNPKVAIPMGLVAALHFGYQNAWKPYQIRCIANTKTLDDVLSNPNLNLVDKQKIAREMLYNHKLPALEVLNTKLLSCAWTRWGVTDEQALENVKVLVHAGAEVNYRSDDGRTVLEKACERRDLEMIKYLVDKKASVQIGAVLCATLLNCIINTTEVPKIHNIVQFLLSKHKYIPVMAKYKNGTEQLNALSQAKRHLEDLKRPDYATGAQIEEMTKIVKALEDKVEEEITHKLSCQSGSANRPELVYGLLSDEFEDIITNKNYRSILVKILKHSNNIQINDIINQFIEKELVYSNEEKRTLGLVEYFLEAGGDVNHINNGMTLLEYAANAKKLPLLKLLLEKGADPKKGSPITQLLQAKNHPTNKYGTQEFSELVKMLELLVRYGAVVPNYYRDPKIRYYYIDEFKDDAIACKKMDFHNFFEACRNAQTNTTDMQAQFAKLKQ